MKNDVINKLNVLEWIELTLEELKSLENHERVVMIDFTGFLEEDMQLCYDVQVTCKGTTRDSGEYEVTVYQVFVRAYKGF